MSDDELKKYKEMYNDLVKHVADLHNKNMHYTKATWSGNAGIQVRGIIRKILNSASALRQQTKLVYKEGARNHKEKIKLERERALERTRKRELKKAKQDDNN